MEKNNVIVALATPPLISALALIRVSGDGVFDLTEKLFAKPLKTITKRASYIGDICFGGEVIDNVVLIAYPHPNSFTGEDVVEICCHGSPLIANEIISAYIALGARYAERGEFSSRGFFNGKMDLIEAESINDLINATTKEAKKIAMMSYKGQTSKLVEPIMKSLADLLALIEVNIDYPEYEDIEEANEQTIVARCEAIRADLCDLIRHGEEGKIIRSGINIAIVGRPNVGKSSLLNAMLHENKAIVTDIPGTTRDIVEGEISLKGVPVRFLDTAGIREGTDLVESIGVERSLKTIEEADLVIVVLDATNPNTEEDEKILERTADKHRIVCFNKRDLNESVEGVAVSAIQGEVGPLLDAIYESLGLSKEAYELPSLSNARELGALRNIDLLLKEAIEDSKNQAPIDLVAADLMSAYNTARELVGIGATTDLTDEIFSRFCVGK